AGVVAAAAGVLAAAAASPGCRLAAWPPPQPAASSAAPRGSASNRSDFARDTGSVHRRPGDPAGRFVGRRLDSRVVLGRGAAGGLAAAVRPRRAPVGPAVDRAATGRGGEVVGALPVPVLDRGGGPVGPVGLVAPLVRAVAVVPVGTVAVGAVPVGRGGAVPVRSEAAALRCSGAGRGPCRRRGRRRALGGRGRSGP